jgi:methyltransferase family protein
VIATDPSAAQLAYGAPHRHVHYARACAEQSGLAGAVVDLAVAAQAAHWFDLPAYYAEVRRVARAGAVVALVSYGVILVNDAIDPVVRRFHTDVLGPYWRPERRHVESGYRSLPFPFPEIAAPRLEIQVQWALADLMGYVDTWSAVEALRRAEGDGRLAAFRRDLADAWGPAGAAHTVRWPLALRVGLV